MQALRRKKKRQTCFCRGAPANRQLKFDFQIRYLRFVEEWEGPKPSLQELPVFWLDRSLQFIKKFAYYTLTGLSFRAERVQKSSRASLDVELCVFIGEKGAALGLYWGKCDEMVSSSVKLLFCENFLASTNRILWKQLSWGGASIHIKIRMWEKEK